MELVRSFPKGHAVPPPKVPWYEATVTYLILLPGVILWFIGVPLLIGYWPCTSEASVACIGGDVLRSSTGSYSAIVAVGAASFFFSFAAAVVAQFTVRKLFFPLVWLVALASLLGSVYGYAVMSGMLRTPWGHLIPLG